MSSTGTVRTVVTEGDGQYRVPALLPGRYDVTGELAGSRTVSATGINLATSQEVRQNLRLALATLQETITVTAESPVVEVSKTEVAAVITKEQLEMLPVANRALVTLSLLLPGTSQDGTRPRRNNAQVGAGTLQFTTLALADGTLNMSTKAGEPRQDFPQAAVREVRVVTAPRRRSLAAAPEASSASSRAAGPTPSAARRTSTSATRRWTGSTR